ncbi:MAG: hypothetical protein ACXVH1_37310, partial [Solirubrobacteraceae bacterium]
MLARSWLTPTSAFRKSDRRDLPGADERNGDLSITPAADASRFLCHVRDRGSVLARDLFDGYVASSAPTTLATPKPP